MPSKKKKATKTKIPYFQSNSQRKKTGRTTLLFGSKRVVFYTLGLILLSGLVGAYLLQQSRQSNAATPESYNGQSSGASLTYTDDARTGLVNGVTKTLETDVRGNGSFAAVPGGVKYTSLVNSERSEHRLSGSNLTWSDNSSGWFAFDFTIHDQDSEWRVIEQEHEYNMSPSRALETSGSTLKLASRYGTPHTRGPDKAWNVKTVVPGERIQIVGYEKFGQGNAVMQAWWRPYGSSTWIQFANSTGFSMGYTSGTAGRYHKRGTYHGNYNEASSVTWYGTAVMHSSLGNALYGAGISNTTTPPPAPAPAPAPTPSPTPSVPPANTWSSWIPGAKADGGVPISLSQTNGLLLQYDGKKLGYLPLQWGNYCLNIPTSYAVPSSITFSATYNPNNFNRVYFYSGVSSNKSWIVEDTGGVATTKTITLSMQGKRKACFGNEVKTNISTNFPANRYLKINSYKFNP